VESHFRLIVGDRRLDSPDLFRREFRQEKVRKAGASGHVFGLVDGPPDQGRRKLGTKLAGQLNTDRFFETSDQIGE